MSLRAQHALRAREDAEKRKARRLELEERRRMSAFAKTDVNGLAVPASARLADFDRQANCAASGFDAGSASARSSGASQQWQELPAIEAAEGSFMDERHDRRASVADVTV